MPGWQGITQDVDVGGLLEGQEDITEVGPGGLMEGDTNATI